MGITDNYQEFCNTYHKGLIAKNNELKFCNIEQKKDNQTLRLNNKIMRKEIHKLRTAVEKVADAESVKVLKLTTNISNLKSLLVNLEKDSNNKLEKQHNEIVKYREGIDKLEDNYGIEDINDVNGYIHDCEEDNEELKKKVDELEKKVDEANKIMEEYKELKEFKEKTEEECEASAVMEDMMKRIQEAERKEKMWYDKYKEQKPSMDDVIEQNKLLGEYLMEEYNLNKPYTINRQDWSDRMCNFYNRVMSKTTDVSWWEFLCDYDIDYESYDTIMDCYKDGEEIRIQYSKECLGLDEDDEDYNKIVNGEEDDYDWDNQEVDYVEWYIDDYMNARASWCDYDGSYWYIK